MTKTSINALYDTINELKQKNNELEIEHQILKLKYDTERVRNENKKFKCDRVFDSFICGMEDEKGIDKKNKEYQEKMDFALRLIRKLKEDVNLVMWND